VVTSASPELVGPPCVSRAMAASLRPRTPPALLIRSAASERHDRSRCRGRRAGRSSWSASQKRDRLGLRAGGADDGGGSQHVEALPRILADGNIEAAPPGCKPPRMPLAHTPSCRELAVADSIRAGERDAFAVPAGSDRIVHSTAFRKLHTRPRCS